MKRKHHKQIVDILYNEWDLGKIKSQAKGKTCAWIYWFLVLSEIDRIILEKEDDTVIALCGYKNRNSKKHKFRKIWYKMLRKLLILSPLVKNKQAIYQFDDAYDYCPEELEKKAEGEIIILMVHQNHRGKSLGKKLLNNAFQIAKQDGIKNMQILTDEGCNYQFYEKIGCKKIYETIVPNSEPDKNGNITSEKGFIYQIKL